MAPIDEGIIFWCVQVECTGSRNYEWRNWIFCELRVPELGPCPENMLEFMDIAPVVDGKFVYLDLFTRFRS